MRPKLSLSKTILSGSKTILAGVLVLGAGAGWLQVVPSALAQDQSAAQGQAQAPNQASQDQASQDQALPQAPTPSPDQGPPPDQAPPPGQASLSDQAPPPGQPPHSAQLSPDQLQQLVAPIALYPDALVAQILAASAYPTQIVEAQRFVQANPTLKGKDLGDAVDKQDWDPSVKALCQFSSVLANMDKDLSWTSELGDANLNQQNDVLAAVQFMRKKAQDAGNLKSTPQQTVSDQGPNVQIQPANPEIVYVPEYDPEFVYGYPVGLWPGFYPWWGVGGPYVSFGVGFGIGPFIGYGWGWGGWGFDWYHRGLLYGGNPYAFHSHAFYDRNAYFHGNYRGYSAYGRGDRGARGFAEPGRGGEGRGFAEPGRGGEARSSAEPGRGGNPRSSAGTRSGAFSGYRGGGDTRGFESRGRSSFGGGGFGGGGHAGGGGGHGGGGRR